MRVISAWSIGFSLWLTVAGSATAADWPMYRADAARSGYTHEALPNQLNLRWTVRMRHPPRPAWPTTERLGFDKAFQPIVVGPVVILGSSADDKVTALDAETGRVRWEFFTDGPVRFAPAAWRDRVFVASDDGWLYALSLSEGRLLWKHRGGPDDRKILGNDRMISRWPARGGPLVLDEVVYFAAGIWPSDGVYLHALDPQSGAVKWTNGRSGTLEMPQPHGGANAKSGVSAQGYLLASEQQLFVPTGRSVPAAFRRDDGRLSYYHLQKNQQRGGVEATYAEGYLFNAGCLFEAAGGELAVQQGLGPIVATPEGILRASGRSLVRYRWVDAQRRDRKGNLVRYRALEENRLTPLDHEVISLIVAGGDAVCGQAGRVSVNDFARQRTTWWSHEVDGDVLGLAAANDRLIATTDRGVVYCFDGQGAAVAGATDAPTAGSSPPPADRLAEAAEEILRKTNITDGYCIDLGGGTGDLALELARRSNLQIVVVESDADKVAAARQKLDRAGLYGVRVTVHQSDPGAENYPRYFADLVVSSRSLEDAVGAAVNKQSGRLQRPYGGKICIGPLGAMKVDTRGDLAGAGSWTHQTSNAANTICSMDKLVKGPLRTLWFRDVDFEVPNRHGQGPTPLAHRGFLVVGGVDGLCAVDAYNGRTRWVFQQQGLLKDYDGIHHDVGVGETGGSFCLSEKSVYLRAADRCLRIDLASGEKLSEFKTPVPQSDNNRNWGFLAYSEGTLYGSVANQEHRVSPRYQNTSLRTESVLFFAMDAQTGQVKWKYWPRHSIRNNAIAITKDHVYLIDRPLATADHIATARRDGRHGPLLKPGEHSGGTLIALDAKTGDVVWEQDDDVFGTQLAVSVEHGVLLMYYQAVRHNFFKLPSEIGGRIAAFNTADGRRRWDQQGKYQSRPLINDYTIYAQGGAWDLINGAEVPFPLARSYGCGQISAGANLLLFRSGTLGYLDLSRKAGTENFGGMRPGCWINAIPAGGVVLVPDGSSKCKCSYQMKAWFALAGD